MVNSYSVRKECSEAFVRLREVDCLPSNWDSRLLRIADSSVSIGTVTSDNPDPVLIVCNVL
jgi:hypothetical protein